MSVTTFNKRITTYNPVVATTEFAALFPVFDNDDLTVLVDGVERTDFAVSATYVEGVSTDAKAVFAVGIVGRVDVVSLRDPHRTNRGRGVAMGRRSLRLWARAWYGSFLGQFAVPKPLRGLWLYGFVVGWVAANIAGAIAFQILKRAPDWVILMLLEMR
ncbi:hypothetical protein BCY90_17445 [Agrobacterium deltaense]|nr:hypothetical protein L901_26365 [Agrobacterium sp. D14]RKF41589.1 hypothetical protein BCY90_17445 [Agrobacterium deltaense]